MEIAFLLNIFIVISNMVYAVCKKRNSRILITISFVVLFILMAGYRGSLSGTGLSHDMYNYNRTYNMVFSGEEITSFIEPGYLLIISFFARLLQVDFLSYYAIMHIICLFFILRMAKLYGTNVHIVLALFSLFFMIYSCEQFQNYISIVIATYSICILISERKRFTKLKFIFGVLIAATIHYTSILYLAFIFFDKKKTIRGVLLFIFLIIAIQLVSGSRFNLNHIIASGLFGDALDRYNTSTNMGYLYGVFLQCMNIVILYINQALLKKIQKKNNSYLKHRIMTENILAVNMLAWIFVPLYMINTQTIRLVRWLLLINFISCANTITCLKVDNKKVIMSVYLLWISIFALITCVFISNTVHSLIIPFYRLNAFIDKLTV